MNYPHQLPRFLHKAGNQLYVATVDACVEALKDGWLIDPNTPPAEPPEPEPAETVRRPSFKKGKR